MTADYDKEMVVLKRGSETCTLALAAVIAAAPPVPACLVAAVSRAAETVLLRHQNASLRGQVDAFLQKIRAA
mgnify:CR=1 FL=1